MAELHGGFLSPKAQQFANDYLQRQIAALTEVLLTKRGALRRGFAAKHANVQARDKYQQQVQGKKSRFWTRRQLPQLYKECTGDTYDILARENVPLYKRWLRGAERYLRRSQLGYSPTTHDHGILKRTVSLGRRRTRFPASGRRRASYDSMLHAFTKRRSSSRFRRVAATRFLAVVPLITGEFKFNQAVYEHNRTLRRRRRLSQRLGRVAYLAPTWRELLMFRAASPIPLYSVPQTQTAHAYSDAADKGGAAYPRHYGLPFGGAAKRRFASLPTNVAFKQRQARAREFLSSSRQQTHALRVALLRHALRRRRVERTIFDLRKHALTRRLAKDQLSPP